MMPTDDHGHDGHDASANAGGDAEMTESRYDEAGGDPEPSRGGDEAGGDTEPSRGGDEAATPTRTTFMSYLQSPIVNLLVGQGDEQQLMSAHQALLVESPFFESACRSFVEDGSVGCPPPPPTPAVHGLALTRARQPRQIELLDEDVNSVGSFLEYLYTGEYFPKKLAGQRVLESDPSLPKVDDTGVHLLKHARLYTLAEKLGMASLKSLAGSKIHCVNSTVKGELTYARYVYTHTSADDNAVRAPIASFWATRSHTLRAEAEDEFKSLCLEHPQFGYDVLSASAPVAARPCACAGANVAQRACSTRSSSGSAPTRCTRRRAPAHASARGRAAAASRRRRRAPGRGGPVAARGCTSRFFPRRRRPGGGGGVVNAGCGVCVCVCDFVAWV